jgi:hypothetical protein
MRARKARGKKQLVRLAKIIGSARKQRVRLIIAANGGNR